MITDQLQRQLPRLSGRLYTASASFFERVKLLAKTGRAIDLATDPAAAEFVAAHKAFTAYAKGLAAAIDAEQLERIHEEGDRWPPTPHQPPATSPAGTASAA